MTAGLLGDGLATYTPGISERRSGTSRYLHSGIKNADSRTVTSASVEATREYDAFENVIGSGGAAWEGPFGNAGGIGYQEDADTGLKLLGHRYYDSTTGRFLTRDPASSGRHWYTYCDNNPMSGVDPAGLYQLIVYGDTYLLPPGGGFVMPTQQGDDVCLEGKNFTKADLINALVNADEFYFWGHGGTNGELLLANGEVFTDEDLRNVIAQRKKLNKRKMRTIWLRSCWSVRLASMVGMWLGISELVAGFPDSTGGWLPLPHLNPPKQFATPPVQNPGVTFSPQAGKYKEEPSFARKKPRKRSGKGKAFDGSGGGG